MCASPGRHRHTQPILCVRPEPQQRPTGVPLALPRVPSLRPCRANHRLAPSLRTTHALAHPGQEPRVPSRTPRTPRPTLQQGQLMLRTTPTSATAPPRSPHPPPPTRVAPPRRAAGRQQERQPLHLLPAHRGAGAGRPLVAHQLQRNLGAGDGGGAGAERHSIACQQKHTCEVWYGGASVSNALSSCDRRHCWAACSCAHV